MGPLFSILFLAPCLAAAFVLVFAIARVYQPSSVAIRIAAVFIAGSIAGCIAVGVCVGFLAGDALLEKWHVIAFLFALVAGGLSGGAALLLLCVECSVLTLRIWTPPKRQETDR
jgi:hypothetical protein